MWGGWQATAAETINGTNTVAWKHKGSGSIWLSRHNSDWKFIGDGGYGNGSKLTTTENNFQIDFDGNGTIGGVKINARLLNQSDLSRDILTGLKSNDDKIFEIEDFLISDNSKDNILHFNRVANSIDFDTDQSIHVDKTFESLDYRYQIEGESLISKDYVSIEENNHFLFNQRNHNDVFNELLNDQSSII